MKREKNKAAMVLAVLLVASGIAHARESRREDAGHAPTVPQRVKRVTVRAFDATRHGIERGAEATVRGVKRGAEATGRGIETGAHAVGRVAHRIAEKF